MWQWAGILSRVFFLLLMKGLGVRLRACTLRLAECHCILAAWELKICCSQEDTFALNR